jgi:hypothetical protein
MADLDALATACHFSGTHTHMFVGYLRDNLGSKIAPAVLDLAGEKRPVELLLDDTQWRSYEHFRRLPEATSALLGGPESLTDFGDGRRRGHRRRARLRPPGVRVLASGSSNKNDPNDALSVAVAALRTPVLELKSSPTGSVSLIRRTGRLGVAIRGWSN